MDHHFRCCWTTGKAVAVVHRRPCIGTCRSGNRRGRLAHRSSFCRCCCCCYCGCLLFLVCCYSPPHCLVWKIKLCKVLFIQRRLIFHDVQKSVWVYKKICQGEIEEGEEDDENNIFVRALTGQADCTDWYDSETLAAFVNLFCQIEKRKVYDAK